MYPNPYQSPYQPNQFSGFSPMVEPPLPTRSNQQSSGKFWVGFLFGILTAIIIGVSVELFKRLRNRQTSPSPEPIKEKEVTFVKEIAEEIPTNIFEVSRTIPKQTFEEFREFLTTIGFTEKEDFSDVTCKTVWTDKNDNQIHFGNFDFTVKRADGKSCEFSNKEALFVEFNQNIVKFFA